MRGRSDTIVGAVLTVAGGGVRRAPPPLATVLAPGGACTRCRTVAAALTPAERADRPGRRKGVPRALLLQRAGRFVRGNTATADVGSSAADELLPLAAGRVPVAGRAAAHGGRWCAGAPVLLLVPAGGATDELLLPLATGIVPVTRRAAARGRRRCAGALTLQLVPAGGAIDEPLPLATGGVPVTRRAAARGGDGARARWRCYQFGLVWFGLV